MKDLEESRYPATTLLKEALCRTFLAKYFYFGFKVSNCEGSASLADVFSTAATSVYSQLSQLDKNENFDNTHTLAYQMLPGSESVYATVTDHMRLLVKQLRAGACTEINSTLHFCDKSIINKTTDKMTPKTYGCKFAQSMVDSYSHPTLSVSHGQESLLFSFEINQSVNQTKSAHEITTDSLHEKSHASVHQTKHASGFKQISSETVEEFHDSHITEEQVDSLTEDFDAVTFEDENDFQSSIYNYQSLIDNNNGGILEHGELLSQRQIDQSLSDLPVTQRLVFDSQTDLDELTCTRIDRELKKREISKISEVPLSQSQHTCGFQNTTNNDTDELNLPDDTVCLDNHVIEHSEMDAVQRKLNNLETGFDQSVEENQSGCHLDQDGYSIDHKKHITASTEHLDCIEELVMPESEDINAFFDSDHSWDDDLLDEFVTNVNESPGKMGDQQNLDRKELIEENSQLKDRLFKKSIHDTRETNCLAECLSASIDDENKVGPKSLNEIKAEHDQLPESEDLDAFLKSDFSWASFGDDIAAGIHRKSESTQLHKHGPVSVENRTNLARKFDKNAESGNNSGFYRNVSCVKNMNMSHRKGSYISNSNTEDLESFFNNITDEEESRRKGSESVVKKGQCFTNMKTSNETLSAGRERVSVRTIRRSQFESVGKSKYIQTEKQQLGKKKCLELVSVNKLKDEEELAEVKDDTKDSDVKLRNNATHESDSLYSTFDGSSLDSELDHFMKGVSETTSGRTKMKSIDCKDCQSIYNENIQETNSNKDVLDPVIHSPNQTESFKEVPMLSQVLLKPEEMSREENSDIVESVHETPLHEGITASEENMAIQCDSPCQMRDLCSQDIFNSYVECNESGADDQDQCIILESQDFSPLETINEKISEDKSKITTRRVQFDSRLHSVRSCELMDVKMKLNKQSPVDCLLVMSPRKPCLRPASTLTTSVVNFNITNKLNNQNKPTSKNLENTNFSENYVNTATCVSGCCTNVSHDAVNYSTGSMSGTCVGNSFNCSQDLFSTSADLFMSPYSGSSENMERRTVEQNENHVDSLVNDSCSDLFTTFNSSPLQTYEVTYLTPITKENRMCENTFAISNDNMKLFDCSKPKYIISINGNNSEVEPTPRVSPVTCVKVMDTKLINQQDNSDIDGDTVKGEYRSAIKSCFHSYKTNNSIGTCTPDIFGDSFQETDKRPCFLLNKRKVIKPLAVNTPDSNFSKGSKSINKTHKIDNLLGTKLVRRDSSSCDNKCVKTMSFCNHSWLVVGDKQPTYAALEKNLLDTSGDLFDDSLVHSQPLEHPVCDSVKPVPNNPYLLCKKLFF